MNNRPRGRTVYTGSGTGNVGRTGGGFAGGHFSRGGGRSSGGRRSGGFGCLPVIIIILVLAFGGGSLTLSSLLGGSDYQGVLENGSNTYTGWQYGSNTNELNTEVSPLARDKFTTIKGNGRDEVTIMVYMCATDLESDSGMATKDLNEMLNADIGDKVNLIVLTGGCKRWRNDTISSKHNQIWQIKDGQIECLVSNAGNGAMTRTSTLTDFIRWTNKNFPANRKGLILWDHGSGSISGYGYDQNYPGSSLTLSGLKTALKDADTRFDFIGFDACLMATSETALVLGDYADYMIASEELEPGVGWYYTNWLSQLNSNTSEATLQIGKTIIDDYTVQCRKHCPGQATTLSLTDLSELSQTLPDSLNAFAGVASNMISDGDYKTVSIARSGAREFARSESLDQIDLAHFALLLDNNASNRLAEVIMDAVKYNRTSANVSNAYGLSIYFPYKTLNKVDTVTNTYKDIGLSKNYTKCIQKFAQMEVSGQVVAGGSTISPFDVLEGGTYRPESISTDEISHLIGQLLAYELSAKTNIAGLDDSNTEFMRTGGLTAEEITDTLVESRINPEDLRWQENYDGNKCIKLTEDQWSSVQTVDLEMFYDDGSGYIDLGLDNLYDFDRDGNLLPYMDKNWLSINGQTVAYYHTETLEKENGEYSISGYVPINLNGERAKLILTFDNENERGYIAGVSYDYDEDVTETAPKNLPGLMSGDSIEFLCDYYSYKGSYEDSYQLGRTWTVKDPDNVTIENLDLGSGHVKLLYKFTDIYGQEYWTDEIDQ